MVGNHNYLNLSLRSIFHLFVSGSLFYFFQNKFHTSLFFGVIGAFGVAVLNEILEDFRKIENSFHTQHVFKRDRTLAGLSLLFTTALATFDWLFATLLAPLSLIALTSYIDKKTSGTKVGRRNLIKPITDIAALTLGPVACVMLLKLIR